MSKRTPLRNVTIGTDPELFLIDTVKNVVKSAISIVPGTKEEPHRVDELGDGFALQTDNILCEFNIPPVTTGDDFVNHIESMKNYIRKFVQATNPNLDLLCAASQMVAKSELKSAQARQFGCDPDYCCYTRSQNEVKVAKSTQLRSAGFHIHVGYDNNEIERSLTLLYYMDAYLGIPSILIDKDAKRRSLYGKAGCFRLQPYGVEYRTLSSFFLANPQRIKWVWNQTVKAISAYNDGLPIPMPEEAIECINNNNEKLAKALCSRYNLCVDFLES